MPIHHATVKSAASKGVTLTSDDMQVVATGHGVTVALDIEDEEANVTDIAKDALNAVLEIRDYQIEHPSIRVRFEDGDFVAYSHPVGDGIARDPDLADLFVTLAEQPEDEADEEPEEGSGSVVPEKYKKLYAERGDATNCGDWLAKVLNTYCRVLEGKKTVTDIDRLEAIASANGVTAERYGKLGVATNGWAGRYRMTVRNMLTKLVAAKGEITIPDGAGSDGDYTIKAPREWCVEHSPKPKAPADMKAKPTKLKKAA